MLETVELSVDQWAEISETFAAFFGPLGSVRIEVNEVSFAAGDTGLVLGSDGTSRSFMPLHELGTRWDSVVFDASAWRVVLTSDDIEYIYRVSPRLIPGNAAR